MQAVQYIAYRESASTPPLGVVDPGLDVPVDENPSKVVGKGGETPRLGKLHVPHVGQLGAEAGRAWPAAGSIQGVLAMVCRPPCQIPSLGLSRLFQHGGQGASSAGK